MKVLKPDATLQAANSEKVFSESLGLRWLNLDYSTVSR
jgi:hypothetical protein